MSIFHERLSGGVLHFVISQMIADASKTIFSRRKTVVDDINCSMQTVPIRQYNTWADPENIYRFPGIILFSRGGGGGFEFYWEGGPDPHPNPSRSAHVIMTMKNLIMIIYYKIA